MKQTGKMTILFLLILITGLLCGGCGAGSSNEADKTGSTATELTSYQQAQLTLGQICGFGKVGDQYVMVGADENGEYIKLTGEALDGEFTREKLELTGLISGTDMLSAAYICQDGSIYLAASSVGTGNSITSRIAVITPENELRILSEEIDGNVDSIRLLDDGSGYVISCSGDNIYCFDMKGQERWDISDVSCTDMCVAGDSLVVLTERNILVYDVSNGSLDTTISSFDGTMAEGLSETAAEKGKDSLSCSNIMQYDKGTDQLYIVLNTGIFAYKLSDRLGIKITTFKNTGRIYDFVIEAEDTFAVVEAGLNNKKNIVVYSSSDTYASGDKGQPQTEKKQVTLYSLYYSETYETLVSWYMGDNPDMDIEYIWGVDDQNGISESDAINSLNTQLLAGEGPDVLIMDGLNVKSYEDTGVLMELARVLEDIQQENPDCLENVLNTYRNPDGSIYAVPAYETFTAVVAPGSEIGDLTDVESLVIYMNSLDKPANESDMSFYYWECYFDTLYPLYASDIVDMHGTYNRERLKEFLTDLKSMYDAGMARTTKEQIADWTAKYGTYEEQTKKAVNSAYMSSLFNRDWSGRRFALVDMKSELEVQYFYSIKEDAIVGMEENTANADYEYMLWGNDEGAVYTPNTIFAINNKEDNRDNGIRFVKDMFGVDVQKMYYGIDVANPVNIDGIRASNEMALEMGTPGGGIKVGENQYLDWSYWRTDEYLEDYIDKLRQLKVPSNTDARIRNMIRDNMADYLEGGVSLDDTMDAVDSALSVYLSE